MEHVYTTCNAESEEIANRSKIGNFSRIKLRCHCEQSLEVNGGRLVAVHRILRILNGIQSMSVKGKVFPLIPDT